MSRTAFIHEIQDNGKPAKMVTLTLDATETLALAEVAAAAVDAGVLLRDTVDEQTAANAEAILSWALRAATALQILEKGPAADAEE